MKNIDTGTKVRFHKINEVLRGEAKGKPNQFNHVGVHFEDGTFGYCNCERIEVVSESPMIVETGSLPGLIENHGCRPNDMRHFMDDLEVFFERQQSAELYSLKSGMSSLLKSLIESGDDVNIGAIRSILIGYQKGYNLK